MNIDRNRPPEDCEDIEMWLSETIGDALHDCKERGMSRDLIVHLLFSYAQNEARLARWSREEWVKAADELYRSSLKEGVAP